MEFSHKSVLLNETIKNLNIKEDGIYADLTLGKGGHSKEILKNLSPEGLLIGLDQDKDAIKAARENLKDFSNVLFFNENFEKISDVLDKASLKMIDGALMDIGVSSYQIDNGDRGFSYMKDGPLDMRMNKDNELTAKQIVNDYSLDELWEIFSKYGEERYSKTIAKAIVDYRKLHEINTTLQLRNIVMKSVVTNEAHPEKRVFQALRIEVNRELEVLENTLEKIVDRLNKGGRLCVITFHSLEDRIVKNKFKEMSKKCICPPEFPVCVCNHEKKVKIISKKPILPSKDELKTNRRSHSAKLRVCERV
ncbi:16S rRNA (cytosine(1402)-N(4))-methyltransferase RsmH [Anaerococcus hydrogenalis]|uniref:Ribosomal RNA small subunit methyltransferase H n=2 Tax=Anaerococcus hydrogenalis TaxID=33029 RepID=B6WAW2_9FIRM|nr:16S rRNA (cytosine(1402)-N(4))-methyltransferase RsmH [Anaerococcus hydrogenalis]EEB35462.1 S-adenosyl-methyltransferase MraW [Anaerococcus hydrogenalis DSM 7454]MDK7695096.1 16S rRNA (cytosine(1402)-N(4))-methyltransferase RsmH [Anaerococcus hydrogenalis]MDK7696929.1 16S rRNA (cytosine(1402)-N(4))-methyltransferase RsmH [Anaerococcus hydrogenalis]MDK7708123.1 16S rRNA (cytosine(1402)-N(4))-methyltransferase RsmH [Anaerococcus hydrogenalis]PMC81925.1 16S rRNA (cytosine(1402)-N(4))-methyltra